jgi:elongation factor Ts
VIRQFAKKIAMHITATNPLALNISDLDDTIIVKERKIITKQMEHKKKSRNIIEKIVEGKIAKFYENNVLMEQNLVMDNGIKIKELHDTMKATYGIHINNFIRLAAGENIDE